MAKKKKADSGQEQLSKIVEDLIADVGDDRLRLSNFLDKLLSEYSDSSGGIAEHVAKLADALTKQHQIRVSTMKQFAESIDHDDGDDEMDDDEIAKSIGRPFEEESGDAN